MYNEDTIAAISTPPGEGGIGIVRLSGSNAEAIIKNIFVSINGKTLSEIRDRHFYYGKIINRDRETIDEVMMVLMRKPRSYTKEDVAEIHCHGGMIPLRRILSLLLQEGARLAEPGEFTKRAFLNGRIDLTQAEGIMDLIAAKSEEAAKASVRQLEGIMSKRIRSMRDKLLNLLAHIEVTIDYPEEDIEPALFEDINNSLLSVGSDVQNLLDTADQGKLIRNGLKTVIIGKPNVGKSSLLNALVKENRAIVTDIPGTTRDIIEESINIRGILVRILDTAGIRETLDVIERMGVERSKKNIEDADLLILMLDASRPLDKDDEEILSWIVPRNALIVLNKIDKNPNINIEEIKRKVNGKTVIPASMVENKGVQDIEQYIYNMVFSGELSQKNDYIAINIRHQEALEKAQNHLNDSLEALAAHTPLDLISIDIRGAWEALGSITGETLTEDLIDKIFKEFCLGK